jgi:hypothetical protein
MADYPELSLKLALHPVRLDQTSGASASAPIVNTAMSSAAKVIAWLHEGMSWTKFLKKMPLGKQGALWALSSL